MQRIREDKALVQKCRFKLYLHWPKHQISLHTGVLKEHGEKSYHIAFSNDLSHDQCFVKSVPRIC